MLLGLSGMFLALGMIILAMSIGSGTMRLGCVFVMFRRLVVVFFHGVSSLLSEECRHHEYGPQSGIRNPAMMVKQKQL